MSGFVRNWLEQGRIDLAILYTKSTDPRLAVDTLVNEELVLIVPADQPVEGPISLVQLSEFQLILPSKGHGLRDLIETVMRECGAQINVSMEIDSFRNIKNLVAKGFGVSILPLHAVAEEVASGLLFHIRLCCPRIAAQRVFGAYTKLYPCTKRRRGRSAKRHFRPRYNRKMGGSNFTYKLELSDVA